MVERDTKYNNKLPRSGPSREDIVHRVAFDAADMLTLIYRTCLQKDLEMRRRVGCQVIDYY